MILSISGSRIKRLQIEKGINTIDEDDLPTSIYIIKRYDKKGNPTPSEKFIKIEDY